MRLSLKTLKQIVGDALQEDAYQDAVKNELHRVFGNTINLESSIPVLMEDAYNRIEVLRKKGQNINFQTNVILPLINHVNPKVRKFAAQVLPEQYLLRMRNDKSYDVRCELVKRLPIENLNEFLNKYQYDDNITFIANKRLNEAKKKNITDIQSLAYNELSDQWYITKAKQIHDDYDHNLEGNWEEKAVSNFCASYKATTGVVVDKDKLLKCVYDILNFFHDILNAF